MLGNYASRFYKFAIEPVRALQRRLEIALAGDVSALETKIHSEITESPSSGASSVVAQLTRFTLEKGQQVSAELRDLFPYLITHYRDGYVLTTDTPTIGITKMFYPRWWLEATGYFRIGPNKSPSAIMFASREQALSEGATVVSVSFYFISLLVTSLISVGIATVMMRYTVFKNEAKGYQRIVDV